MVTHESQYHSCKIQTAITVRLTMVNRTDIMMIHDVDIAEATHIWRNKTRYPREKAGWLMLLGGRTSPLKHMRGSTNQPFPIGGRQKMS